MRPIRSSKSNSKGLTYHRLNNRLRSGISHPTFVNRQRKKRTRRQDKRIKQILLNPVVKLHRIPSNWAHLNNPVKADDVNEEPKTHLSLAASNQSNVILTSTPIVATNPENDNHTDELIVQNIITTKSEFPSSISFHDGSEDSRGSSDLDSDSSDDRSYMNLYDINENKSEVFVVDSDSAATANRSVIPNGSLREEDETTESSTMNLDDDGYEASSSSHTLAAEDDSRLEVDTSYEANLSSADELETPTGKCRLYPQGKDGFIVALQHPFSVLVYGKVSVRMLSGSTKVNGYVLKNRNDFLAIYSPKTNSHIVISTFDEERKDNEDLLSRRSFLTENLSSSFLSNSYKDEIIDGCEQFPIIIHCKKLEDRNCTFLQRHNIKVFNIDKKPNSILGLGVDRNYDCEFYDLSGNLKHIRSDSRWKKVAEDVRDSVLRNGTPPRIIVCGGKKIGKSTFCQFLINSLLNTCESVCYIEGDPGQTEFTPPGLLSFHEISTPCFGPSYTHLRTPEKAFFLGATSPVENPSLYVSCIEKLWETYCENRFRSRPLVINTMGWNKGIGLSLLADMVNVMQPTYVIQINCPVFKTRNFPPLSHFFLEEISGWTYGRPRLIPFEHYVLKSLVDSQRLVYIPSKLRQISLLSYLSKLYGPGRQTQSLNKIPFHKIPWSQVALHVCNANVPNSQILYVFNCSLIALCISDPENMVSTDDPSLPKFIKTMPVCDWLAYGIVRDININEKCFHIITSLPVEALSEVNTLLKGDIEIPANLLLEQVVDSRIPYTVTRKALPGALELGMKVVADRAYRMKKNTTLTEETRDQLSTELD